MSRVWVDIDEWWPVYEIVPSYGVREVDLDDAVIEHVQEVFLEWRAIQNLLHEAVENAKGDT